MESIRGKKARSSAESARALQKHMLDDLLKFIEASKEDKECTLKEEECAFSITYRGKEYSFNMIEMDRYDVVENFLQNLAEVYDRYADWAEMHPGKDSVQEFYAS